MMEGVGEEEYEEVFTIICRQVYWVLIRKQVYMGMQEYIYYVYTV